MDLGTLDIKGFLQGDFWITRFIFGRALAAIYAIGFLIIINQFKPLLGSNGLLPAKQLTGRYDFWELASLFHFNVSDTFLLSMGYLGFILSLFALSGLSESYGYLVSFFTWFVLWFLYLSFVNIGRIFYGFGWESMLLEVGFLTMFLGSNDVAPPVLIIWLLRVVLFKNMFGAGMIKIRGDECWTNLTCMYYYYQTQPVPNPLSPFFHSLPKIVHKASIVWTHFCELIVPWGYLLTNKLATIAGILSILFQGLIVVSGNLSWLNYLTIVMCIPCFDDQFLGKIFPIDMTTTSDTTFHLYSSVGLFLFIMYLNLNPFKNLFSSDQAMNRGFDSFHLVNTYGAFGSVPKIRNEIVIKGTNDDPNDPEAHWLEYEFKGKPTNINKPHPIMSPYHWRLDWQMWFATFGHYRYNPWILNLIYKLLQGDKHVENLLSVVPFSKAPPRYIKADFYEYRFHNEKNKFGEQGKYWDRKYINEYIPPLDKYNPNFLSLLEEMGWIQSPNNSSK